MIRSRIFKAFCFRRIQSNSGVQPDVNVAPPYYLYADYLITYLAANAPRYAQPIQTMGHSTGCMPAMDMARRLNTVYGDSRYTIQRVALLDAGCGNVYNYPEAVEILRTESLTGEPFWVENYYSNAPYLDHTLNIRFPVPPASHGTPPQWYRNSTDTRWWPNGELYNDGMMGGDTLSVAGPGKNMQIIDDPEAYCFEWIPGDQQALRPFDEEAFPGRLPEPVTLLAPANPGDYQGVVLSCETRRNAQTYELLLGDTASPVDEFAVAMTSDSPPEQPLAALPYEVTWWTIRVRDAFGSTHHADPQPLNAGALSWPISNTRTGERFVLIQDAIDQAQTGDHIAIAPGAYPESLHIEGKSLILQAGDATGAVVVTGLGQRPVVTVEGDTTHCQFLGLTLARGSVGMSCLTGDLTLSHCIIQANQGHGLHISDRANVLLSHCLLVENDGDGVHTQPFISSDYPERGRRQNLVAPRGELLVDQCTIADNGAFGLKLACAFISNSICYANKGGGIEADTPGNVTVQFSDIQGTWPGIGNLDVDPLFVAGDTSDYHLQSQRGHWDIGQGIWVTDDQTSPCVDVGDPGTDVSLEPQPHGARVNMGAYGASAEASLSDG